MNKQNIITVKQNNPIMLDCQYSARALFNRAEKFQYLAMICIFCSALCVFLTGEISSLILPLVLDVLILVFGYLLKTNQTKAASIRKYFDATVLGIKETDYTDAELRDVFSIVDKLVSNNPDEHIIQTTHTGRDFPPGVKNWYEFSKEYPDNEAVFECQRQNCWWNDNLCSRRLLITVCIFVVTIVFYWVFAIFMHVSIIQSVVCFAGLLLGFLEQLVTNAKYISISKTMDDLINLPDIQQNQIQLEHLQMLIDKRRELLVLEINRMHRKNSKTWSEKYEKISKH